MMGAQLATQMFGDGQRPPSDSTELGGDALAFAAFPPGPCTNG